MDAPRTRVLVVEDDPADSGAIDRCLRDAKGFRFDVVHEEHLAGALHRITAEPFDLILLDLELTDSQGIKPFPRLQKANGHVPIVVLTSLDDDEAGIDAVRDGAQDYLSKSRLTSDLLGRSVRYSIERKGAAMALHASEAEYRRLFETAKDGILILDAETGQIDDANQFLIDLLDFSKEDFLGKMLWDIGLFQDVELCKKGFATLQQEGFIRYEHLPIVARNGRTTEVEFISNTYVVADRKRAQCNIRDISERVRAETALREHEERLHRERHLAAEKIGQLNAELEQRVKERTDELSSANKELEAFAYSVSHDLRSPLRAINGFSQILLKEYVQTLPEKPRHYLQMVCDNTRQMGRLIDDLLRFSRSNRQSVQLRAVAPKELVRQCLEEMQSEREGRNVEIQVGELPECWGDGNLLRQVWLNLIGNALKYSRKRDPAKIEIGSESKDGETVYFVRDNGVGFDMQYADKLFGVFQRLHSAEEFEGTGIGLALAQRIVHRHGGRIWADAKVDQGATLRFTLGRRPFHAAP